MPLNVDIKINDRHIETVWIGRMENLTDTDSEHEYIAGIGTQYLEPWNMTPYDEETDVVRFRHKYSDGARECVRKALNALYDLHERENEHCCDVPGGPDRCGDCPLDSTKEEE